MHKMKGKIIAAFATTVVTFATNVAAVNNMNWDNMNLNPYVGVDAQARFMKLKNGFGGNLAAKTYPQGNIFVGLRFCDYWGLEAGYETTTKMNKNVTLLGSESFFGRTASPDPAFANAINKFQTKSNIHGPHINVVGFYPIWDEYGIDLFGSVGLAYLKIKIDSKRTVNDGIDFTPAEIEETRRIFTKRKVIARANLGLQKMFDCNVGVRAMIGWENTSRFGTIHVTNIDSVLIAKARDSFNASVGIFYTFK